MTEIIRETDQVIVRAGNELTATNAQDFRDNLQKIVMESPKLLTIDLSETIMLDSIGMGTFITTFNSLKQTGGKFQVINANNDIYNLLKAMRFDKHFTIKEKL